MRSVSMWELACDWPSPEREARFERTVRGRPSVFRAPQRYPGCRGFAELGVGLQAEAVGHPRKVVEDADQMGHLEQALVVEAQIAKRLPVRGRHLCGRQGQLFGDRA